MPLSLYSTRTIRGVSTVNLAFPAVTVACFDATGLSAGVSMLDADEHPAPTALMTIRHTAPTINFVFMVQRKYV